MAQGWPWDSQIAVRDTHREKAPLDKASTLSKSMNMDIWVVGRSNQLFILVSKLEKNFRKKKVATGKTLFFVVGPFCTPHSIYLNIGFWQSSLVWKCCVVNLYFQLKNAPPVFWKGFAFFQKICFKVKKLKTFKISSDFHIKTCPSFKWIPSTDF